MTAMKLTHFRSLLSGHLRRHGLALATASLAMVGFAAAELIAPWPLKILVDQVLLGKPAPAALRSILPTNAETAVILLAAILLAISLLKAAFAYLQVFLTSSIGYQLVHQFRATLFGHLQRLTLSFHHRARAGELLSKVTHDTSALRDAFSTSVLDLLAHSLTLVGMCVILAVLNWRLALILTVTLPLLALTIFGIYRRGKRAARAQRESEGQVVARLAESMHLTPLIRAFAQERAEERRFVEDSAASMEKSIRTARTEAATSRAVELVSAASVSSALLFGGLMAVRREITPGDLLVFISYLTNMYKPLRNLAKLSAQFARARASAERIEEILRLAPDPALAPGLPVTSLGGEFEFSDVWFGYRPDQPVLRGVNFRIGAGERVALVGASGAGKSTVASLIMRLQTPASGLILADGRPIRDFDSAAYRRQFGIVLQDALLFGATIAENIAYGDPEASVESIEQAARQAAAHDFIEALPQGYQTVIGERGSTLSGGQRQRICLARALLKRPSVLLLDEPTSAVDAASSALIHAAVAASSAGRTTIVIAHHFHDMESFDRILVMKDGVLAESGTHSELLRRGGVYAQLTASQPFREEVAG